MKMLDSSGGCRYFDLFCSIVFLRTRALFATHIFATPRPINNIIYLNIIIMLITDSRTAAPHCALLKEKNNGSQLRMYSQHI